MQPELLSPSEGNLSLQVVLIQLSLIILLCRGLKNHVMKLVIVCLGHVVAFREILIFIVNVARTSNISREFKLYH